MAQTSTSKQFTVNWRDLVKGLVVAIVTPILATVQQSVSAGTLTFNWSLIAISGISAGVAYLGKNFFTPSQTVITNQSPTERAQSEKDAAAPSATTKTKA